MRRNTSIPLMVSSALALLALAQLEPQFRSRWLASLLALAALGLIGWVFALVARPPALRLVVEPITERHDAFLAPNQPFYDRALHRPSHRDLMCISRTEGRASLACTMQGLVAPEADAQKRRAPIA